MNIWQQFKALNPEPARALGVIMAVNAGGGSYTVTLVGGGSVEAVGSGYVLGNRVYVRGGVIEAVAPNLPSFSSVI